jgi:DNA-binding Lrp family transcriptional regulator
MSEGVRLVAELRKTSKCLRRLLSGMRKMDDTPYLDQTDRAVLAQLQVDGRASVTTLAGALNLSRTTVQKRIERLQETGVIRRFTVELTSQAQELTVQAVMLIALNGPMTRSVIAKLNKIPQIADLHSTNGAWDLVAMIKAGSLPEFDRTLKKVREISGVINSETCLLLDRAG